MSNLIYMEMLYFFSDSQLNWLNLMFHTKSHLVLEVLERGTLEEDNAAHQWSEVDLTDLLPFF